MMSKMRLYDYVLLVSTLGGCGAWLATYHVTRGYGLIQALGFGAFVLADALLLAEKWREAATALVKERILTSFRVLTMFIFTMNMLRGQERAIFDDEITLPIFMVVAILLIIEWFYLLLSDRP